MRFPYLAYPVRGIGSTSLVMVYRPSVILRAIGPAGEAVVYGLVDTGADDTMVPDRYIEPLGIMIRPGDHAYVVGIGGGTVPVRFGTLDLAMGRRGAVCRWSARVAFYAGAKVILGHSGFLEYFTATFNGRRRHLTLTPNGDAPTPTASGI